MKHWKRNGSDGTLELAEVVRQVRPTMLIGASTVSGAFREAIVREIASIANGRLSFHFPIQCPWRKPRRRI